MVKPLAVPALLCAVLSIASLASAQSPNPAVTLIVASETAPAGGWVQIKVFAAAPCRITSGSLTLDYDPAVLGDKGAATAISATGDAWGSGGAYGSSVSAGFTSLSGGIGQLPGLPVLVVSMPVAAGLAKGSTTSVTVDVSASRLTDLDGNPYSLAAVPGTITIGGTLSIQSVTPGGGLLPTDTVIQIAGTGFDASTTATLDGVSISPPQLLNSGQINVTLGGTAELTGKHLHLANAAGEQADYFSAPSTSGSVFPLTTYRNVRSPYAQGHPRGFVVLNQTLSPVTVTSWELFTAGMGRILGSATVRPGAVYIPEGGDWGANLYLTASAPIWMLACMAAYDSDECGPPVVSSDEIAIEHSGSVVWNWQVGTPPPPQYGDAYVDLPDGASNSVSVSPSAQQWLVASLTPEFHGSTLTLTPNVSGLLPGTYTGTVTTTFVPPASAVLHVDPGVIQVVLNVSAAPFIVSGGSVNLETSAGGPAPFPKSFNVVAAPGATGTVKFQASVRTDSGGNWLSVTPASGVAPATLTASANPRGLAAGTYTGQITVQGPANTVVVPAQLVVSAAPAPAQPVTPSTIAFTGEVGGASPDTKSVTIQQGSNYSASVQTQSGGNWLSAALSSKYVTLTANTAGLRVGTYQGTVFLTSPSSPALQVPVTLAVLAPPDSLSVSPASLSVTASPGQSAVLSFLVTSPGGPGIFTCDITFVDQREVRGLGAYQLPDCRTTPAIVQMQVSAPWPGTYHGNALFTWTGGSLTVPVTLSVTATSLSPPVLANIVNTASAKPGAISPGEMITLFGTGIGPGPTVFSLDQSGKVPTNLASTQVLIDGRTAPVLYASATQVNAIVPYEVGTTGTATVEVVSNGYQSEIWGVPLSPASPGIFALGSIGVGQAAALNQDNSPNGASNPAARGSVVQFFATGEGSTTPANYTGGVTPNGGNTTALPVKVTIGGVDAAVTYHGSAPGEVAGVLQVNAVVPAGVTPGPAVPVLISVGGKPSQTGITIAVR